MLDTTHAHAISDEGVAFSADALPNSTEGVAFSAAFQAKGLHFRPPPTRADAISDEGVAFSAAFQAKGLHFPVRLEPGFSFSLLPKGFQGTVDERRTRNWGRTMNRSSEIRTNMHTVR